MTPYTAYSQLLFTCVDGPKDHVANIMLTGFNKPHQWSARNASGEAIIQYFVKETELAFSLAYVNEAERDTAKTQRVVFWEPWSRPGTTALMGVFDDGLSHSVASLSADCPYTWINIRIYDDATYPGCFFDYYFDHRRVERRLMACKDESGWRFNQKGPVQSFENPSYYTARMKKDRLNRAIVIEYLKKLGFDVAADDFWRTGQPATFLWQERPTGEYGKDVFYPYSFDPRTRISDSPPSRGSRPPPSVSW